MRSQCSVTVHRGRIRGICVSLAVACASLPTSLAASASDSGAPAARSAPGSPATPRGGSTCLAAEVRWGPVGARIVYREESRLLGCRDFVYVRDVGLGEATCANEVPPDRIASINAALADPGVVQALAEVPASFGADPRLVGGAFLRIEVGGRALEVGGACRRPGARCRAVPSGLEALAGRLREVQERQLGLPGCSGLDSSGTKHP
jgi:hypothetical protein